MHITVAIPTFNRVEELKKCLDSITSQSLDSDIQLSIAISNIASRDGTYSYLSNLEGPDGRFFITNEVGTNEHGNCGSLAATIPPHADWVWLMGDDDYLASPNSISIIHEIIKNTRTSDLSFVHACQARRSARSGKMYEGDVMKLCEEFGYLEMLGWFSSLITRRDIMTEALQNWHTIYQKQLSAGSAFGHSAELLKLLYNKPGAFVDYPLVEPQDDEMTAETAQRWKLDNTAQRYFYVIDDLIEMREQGLFTDTLPSTFFRYHTYSLWDRLISQQLGMLTTFKSIPGEIEKQAFLERFTANWDRIRKLCTMIKDPQIQKYLCMALHHATKISSQFLNGEMSYSEFESAANEQVMLFNAPVHEFNVAQHQDNLSSAA